MGTSTTAATPQADLEAQIDGLVAVTTVGPVSMTSGVRDRFTDDIARKIDPATEIATRYSMSIPQLLATIAVPAIRDEIKEKKAIWESSASAQDRAKQYWAVGLIHAAPTMINAMADEATPIKDRIEIYKIGAKIAGLDSAPGSANTHAATGSQFAVNIFIGDKKEAFSAIPTVVDAEIVPVSPELPRSIEDDDGAAA